MNIGRQDCTDLRSSEKDMDKERFGGLVIVAMKGPPCSGKSTLAQKIAKDLKYLLISQDHCITHLQQKPTTTTTTTDIQHLYNLSFSIICQIAQTQLCLGHRLIIDASLHLRSYLENLHKLSKSTGARLIIVQCKPQKKYLWVQRHLKRVEDEKTNWYKPRTEEDLERLVKSYDDEWLINDYDHNNDIAEKTSKLVVDTTGYVRDWDLTSGVKYLASCHGYQKMDLEKWANDIWKKVDCALWKQNEEEEAEKIDTYRDKDDDEEKFHLHKLVLTTDYKPASNDDDKETCRGCMELISNPSYYKCRECNCGLSVHKRCAELTHINDLQQLLVNCPGIEYSSFPEKHRCDNCTNNDGEEENDDYDECPECLFKTNLRCGMFPSVLHHNCHEHPLCIKTYPISFGFEFKCKACGSLGKHVCYCCEVCGFVTHLHCGLLPKTFKHTTHRHTLFLTPALPHDEYEEFYCDACEKPRNPNHWIYYCDKCEFVCHLNCDA